MKIHLSALMACALLYSSLAQMDPPTLESNSRRSGTWIETRFDEPDVLIVHRNGRQMRVNRVPGTGEGGQPLILQGPSEVSLKWVEGPPPGWPDASPVPILTEAVLHDGVLLVQVDGDAVVAADLLADLPEALYAYPVEYTDPMFARIMPTDRVIVSLNSGVVVGQVTVPFGLEVVTNMIGSTREYILRMVDPKVTAASNVVADLEASGLVAWAQRDCLRDGELYFTPNDTRFGNQWHMNAVGQNIGGITAPTDVDVDAPNAWNTTAGGSSVIAVVDDAVETTHPDLAANISAVGAYDFYYNDTNPNPDGTVDGHGTCCAGVAAAVGHNSLGVAGMAYASTIVPVKICGNGVFPYDSTVAQGVRHAAAYADIITCSWGYYNPAPVTLSAVQYALQSGAGGRGALVFFAAGNDGGFIPHMATLGAAGNYTLRWRYTKDSANAGGLDKCFVDSVWYPNGGTEMFDGVTVPALPASWTSGGSGSWISAAEGPGSRAESGTGTSWQFIESPPIADSQSVYVQVVNYGVPASSPMWYYMRVSAEPTTYSGSTATVYDYGQLEYQLAGSPTWTTANVQGGQPDALSFPAQYPETIAVGANDWTSRRSHYSQWSGALDFVAPSDGDWNGLGIETTDMTGAGGYDSGNYCQAATASKFGGTSSACPLAAGIGALVRSANTLLSPAQVRNVLRKSCRKIYPSWYSYGGILGGKDQYVGWGQVDADGALATAAAEIPVIQMANDLKITEVSPLDADCPFVEIYNSSAMFAYQLETLMLTDCEQGGDQGESSFMFPQGMIVPPQSIMVVALGAATVGMINDLNTVIASGAGPLNGIQLFECLPSGLIFNGLPVGTMIPAGGVLAAGINLAASDNIALVITPGMQASYLPDVVDGMAFGMPPLSGVSVIGVGPGISEPATYPAGANGVLSYQRNGVTDTQDSLTDFTAGLRTPGWVAYGVPVASLDATPLASTANEVEVASDPTIPAVMVVASSDPLFNYPVQGMFYPPMSLLGPDLVIYNGPALPSTVIPDWLPYAPSTPVYYRAWSVSPVDMYSAGTDATATTMPIPVPLPFADGFDALSIIDPNLWPYATGVTIDSWPVPGLAGMPPPSLPNCAQLDNGAGAFPRMDSMNIDASTTPNVKLTYLLAETGVGDIQEPADMLDVQILDPSLTWITIFSHPSMGPSPFLPYEHVIDPGLLHTDFRVRFVSQSVIDYAGDLDHWFVDDVTVEEFPVLSGFQWQPVVPTELSSGIPFGVRLTALSSMGGTFTDYGGTPGLTLYTTNGAPASAVSPDPLSGFVSGVWSNDVIISGEAADPVVLVAADGAVTGTSSVFRVYDDIDLDTMLDSWEYGWFGSILVASNAPATDYDKDKFPDASEYVAGTNPTNPASLLYVTLDFIEPGVTNVLVWPSVSNRVYTIMSVSNRPLSDLFWMPVASNVPATPPTNYWTDTSSPSNRAFYKVRVEKD